MEEKKKAKVMGLGATQEKPAKMSYEELENVAAQLSAQNRQLYARVQSMDMTNIFRRLDYLFKVVENAHAFPEDFVTECAIEIRDMLTVPEAEDEPKNSGETELKPECDIEE